MFSAFKHEITRSSLLEKSLKKLRVVLKNKLSSFYFRLAYVYSPNCSAASQFNFQCVPPTTQCCTHTLTPFGLHHSQFLCTILVKIWYYLRHPSRKWEYKTLSFLLLLLRRLHIFEFYCIPDQLTELCSPLNYSVALKTVNVKSQLRQPGTYSCVL